MFKNTMFEEWFMWQVNMMVDDDPMVVGNKITNDIMDYYMKMWFKRIILLKKAVTVLGSD